MYRHRYSSLTCFSGVRIGEETSERFWGKAVTGAMGVSAKRLFLSRVFLDFFYLRLPSHSATTPRLRLFVRTVPSGAGLFCTKSARCETLLRTLSPKR